MRSIILLALWISVPLVYGKTVIGRSILKLIPSHIDLSSPEYKDAREELEELVSGCGPGVVKGATDSRGKELRNTCSFQVALDELFFTPKSKKTGLLQDWNWAYRDNVTWVKPKEMAVPDNFDLRDYMSGGQPEIRQQQCGDCWAWSTHHGLEIARAVHDVKAFDHSIQTVLSCSKSGSCSGGYMSAVDFLAHGLPYEPDFPYKASSGSCKYSTAAIQTGWDGKVIATPYIGESLRYSRAMRNRDGSYREGNKVKEMMEAMFQWKGPLVVTVAAYSISGNGIYNQCSAINSGGDHMVAVVGWDMANGKRNAHVWNSWGQGHGDKGVSRIQWECGDGRLDRGLGVSAKIVQYKAPCTPPDAAQTYLHEIKVGDSVQIGAPQNINTTCTWVPEAGLSDPHSCVTTAKPSVSTEYHLTAENACGKSSSMTMVYLFGRGKEQMILTPFGEIEDSL